MGFTTALAPLVTATIRDRGREYYRSGAVALESVNFREAHATVSGGRDYEVDLELDGRTVRASCTCPYVEEHGTVCKHIWATALAAEARGFAASARSNLAVAVDGYDDDDAGYYYDEPPRPYARPAAPPARRDGWKEQLEALGREVGPAGPPPP